MIEVYVVNAFTKNGTGGNKAGIVLQDHNLNKQQKTETAYRLGYSETAFVLPSAQADFKLEYFTPVGEVPLCGHATIGTFAVMYSLEMLKKSYYTIETKSGILRIKIQQNGLIFMEQNRAKFYDTIPGATIEPCFTPAEINKNLPVQIVSTGLKDILLPISTPEDLRDMVPDFPMISRISREKECVGIHAFSLTPDARTTAICRNFAPLYGINEESATGTSNSALACYLYSHGFIQNQYIFEQGHNLNSISRIYVKLEKDAGKVTAVYAGGTGLLQDKIFLPVPLL
ncbi:MAG: PhzF family phenazine biosynthesis protein [Eubacteriales bacterium]|nr:PhzF family phenazine biosynthesis protein [Eubacteriales bacterium]